MDQIHEVIVIGAGIAGLGASKELAEARVQHLILESRDRQGGRIISEQFVGCPVDMGASFIQKSSQNNYLLEFIQSEGIKTIEVNKDHEYYYEGKGLVKEQDLERVKQLQKEMDVEIDNMVKNSQGKCSLGEAVKRFVQIEMDGEEPCIRDTLLWKLNLEASLKGAQLADLPPKRYLFQGRKDEVMIQGGFSLIIEKMLKKGKPNIRFNTKVQSVDYSGNSVRVQTTNGLYFAKRVISSLPLGVLKNQRVKFSPQMPETYKLAISEIGNANENKIFCSFASPFWTIESGWLYFMTRSKDNSFPLAFVYPNNKGKHILMVNLSGKASFQFGEGSESKVLQDFRHFLSRFIDTSLFGLEQVRISAWHSDFNSLGSSSLCLLGTKEEHFERLSQPIDEKVWIVGEHASSKEASTCQGAFKTGIAAARQVVGTLRGNKKVDESIQL